MRAVKMQYCGAVVLHTVCWCEEILQVHMYVLACLKFALMQVAAAQQKWPEGTMARMPDMKRDRHPCRNLDSGSRVQGGYVD